MKQIETVAVVGLGAVGAVVAEQLLSVLGNKLYCVMDTERKAHYQASGIVINGKKADFNFVTPDDFTIMSSGMILHKIDIGQIVKSIFFM